MKEIPLLAINGSVRGFTMVDDEDYEWLSQWVWRLRGGYAGRLTKKDTKTGKQESILLHRVVMNCPPDKEIDHRNINPLDNRKCNLRICVTRQNTKNRRLLATNKLGLKGVYWMAERGKYRAQIMVDYKKINLGSFDSAEDAARAYDEAALLHHKDYARINFPVALPDRIEEVA